MATPSKSTTNVTKALPMYKTPIPGGSASWFKKSEVPVIRQRELDILGTRLAPVFKKIAMSDMADSMTKSPPEATVVDPDAPIALGDVVIGDSGVTLDEALELTGMLTDSEVRMLYRLNDVSVWAYLKDWNLTVDGKKGSAPRPLPADPDEVLLLEPKLYDVLQKHAGKLYNLKDPANAFEVDPGVEDPASPTGDSGA